MGIVPDGAYEEVRGVAEWLGEVGASEEELGRARSVLTRAARERWDDVKLVTSELEKSGPLGKAMKRFFRDPALVIATIGVLLAAIQVVHEVSQPQSPPTQIEINIDQRAPERREVREQDVRLHEWTTDEPWIVRNIDFIGCRIFGPAIIHPRGLVMRGTVFTTGTPDGMVIGVPKGTPIVGVWILEDVNVIDSVMDNVGFIADEETAQQMRIDFAGIPVADTDSDPSAE